MRIMPEKSELPRGRELAIRIYCPWSCPGREFCGGGGVEAGGTGAAGGAAPEMCPSAGAVEEARLIAPITMRMTGNVRSNEKLPPIISLSRKSTPTVITMAGPIRLRMVQRRQAQRMRSLIEKSLLRTPVQPVAEHQHAHDDQNYRPELVDAIPGKPIKIVQQEERADDDQNDGAEGAIGAPGFERVRGGCSCPFRLCGTHRIKCHVEDETGEKDSQHRLHAAVHVTAQAENKCCENDDVNQRLVVFTIIYSAEAGKEKPEEKGKPRAV